MSNHDRILDYRRKLCNNYYIMFFRNHQHAENYFNEYILVYYIVYLLSCSNNKTIICKTRITYLLNIHQVQNIIQIINKRDIYTVGHYYLM